MALEKKIGCLTVDYESIKSFYKLERPHKMK